MTEESYRRERLIGLTVPEAKESSMAGRHGSKQQVWWLEQQAKSSHREPQIGSSERKLQRGKSLSSQKPPLMTYSLWQGHHASTSWNITTNWGPGIQMLETMGDIPLQSTYSKAHAGLLGCMLPFLVVLVSHSCWHLPFKAASCSCFCFILSLDLSEPLGLFSSSQFSVVLKTFIFLFLHSKLLANSKLLAFPGKWSYKPAVYISSSIICA